MDILIRINGRITKNSAKKCISTLAKSLNSFYPSQLINPLNSAAKKLKIQPKNFIWICILQWIFSENGQFQRFYPNSLWTRNLGFLAENLSEFQFCIKSLNSELFFFKIQRFFDLIKSLKMVSKLGYKSHKFLKHLDRLINHCYIPEPHTHDTTFWTHPMHQAILTSQGQVTKTSNYSLAEEKMHEEWLSERACWGGGGLGLSTWGDGD